MKGNIQTMNLALCVVIQNEVLKKLQDNGYNKDIVKSVKLHANNYDSTLPIAARVVRYARDFRKVLSLTEKFPTIHDALQDMKKMSGKAYDPYVVEMAEQAFN